MMWARRLAALCGLAVLAGFGACTATEDRVELRLAGRTIEVELARTPEALMTGLMHRPQLDADAGMLFVFGYDGPHCMWMKNTLIPLSAAFIDRAGRVVSISEMMPGSLKLHCPPGPVYFVLEMNAGWFGRHGVQPGMTVEGVAGLAGH